MARVFLFFGVNTCIKNRPVYGNKTWYTDIWYSNIILILFPCHLSPLVEVLNPTGVGKFGDFQPTRRRISEDRATVAIIHL